MGDLALSGSEDELNSQWPDSLDRKPRAFRVLSAFWRVIEHAAREREARLVLIDVGPNLGAVIGRADRRRARGDPVGPRPVFASRPQEPRSDPASLACRMVRTARPKPRRRSLDPRRRHAPAGYIVMQHAVRLDRPVKAYDRWMARIPAVYREAVLAERDLGDVPA